MTRAIDLAMQPFQEQSLPEHCLIKREHKKKKDGMNGAALNLPKRYGATNGLARPYSIGLKMTAKQHAFLMRQKKRHGTTMTASILGLIDEAIQKESKRKGGWQ